MCRPHRRPGSRPTPPAPPAVPPQSARPRTTPPPPPSRAAPPAAHPPPPRYAARPPTSSAMPGFPDCSRLLSFYMAPRRLSQHHGAQEDHYGTGTQPDRERRIHHLRQRPAEQTAERPHADDGQRLQAHHSPPQPARRLGLQQRCDRSARRRARQPGDEEQRDRQRVAA